MDTRRPPKLNPKLNMGATGLRIAWPRSLKALSAILNQSEAAMDTAMEMSGIDNDMMDNSRAG